MKKGLLLLSAILALGSLSSSAQRRTATMTDEEMYLDAMHRNITTEKIFGYVKQLSDPALEGRLATRARNAIGRGKRGRPKS